jgi:hypothetical protein
MNLIDRLVVLAVVVLGLSVVLKTALDAAASVFVPVLAIATAYGIFRGVRAGLFSKLFASKTEERKSS